MVKQYEQDEVFSCHISELNKSFTTNTWQSIRSTAEKMLDEVYSEPYILTITLQWP